MTTPQRSDLMKRVARKDTAPELSVRRHLHALGFRYRLHGRALPGTPDIVLRRFRTVIFVHGCFWHSHHCAHGRVQAQSNKRFWKQKLADNKARDQRKASALRRLGWKVETVWECQSRNARALDRLSRRIRERDEARGY